ncbi:MAG TPA: hypothetical protein VL990_12450 [Acidobacteriaceae bacterium]|nr:hypothetical protein [Acidobacteriaceae bacterium]
MAITRRRFMQNSLGSAVVSRSLFSMLPAFGDGSPSSSPSGRAFGSGYFGEWIEDEFGLPAFRYICNQTTDAKARTDVSPGVIGPTEHIHQVGNDRILAIASNFGHVRVRQDEGTPKFLNDHDPETHQFGGGLGWLTGGQETLSTFYSGRDAAFERIFGVGYFRKRVASRNYAVDQVIFAPFGDDPVLIAQVTIANRSASPAALRWLECWGCQTYEFSFRDFITTFSGIASPPQLRRAAGRRSTHQVRPVENGLLETRHFPGHTPEEDAAWARVRAMLKAQPNGFISPVPDPEPGTWYESDDPPATFLVALGDEPGRFSSDAAAFFGSGGPASPSGLPGGLDGNLDSTGAHTALLMERSLHLQPGEERTLHSLYGYLPAGTELDAFVARYKPLASTALATSSAAWKAHGMRFSVEGEPWIERETTWNHYCLRSSMTFDDYFGQHILNQNGFYEYVMGFQGAARDPLQHSLPFLFSDPEIVRSILRYTLSEVRDNGSVPYAIVGHGVVAPMVADNSSDIPLWLIWAVSEYVLATRDVDFLHESIPARVSGPAGRTDTVANLLARCFRHQVDDVGFGEHGVARMLSDDWNDGLLGTWASSALAEATEKGESVLNSAMSAWVFDEYAEMLRYAGSGSELQPEIARMADRHRAAARAQWNGRWLKRAWLGPTLGWLGDSTLWLEPQPWAVLAGVTTPEQSRALISTMNELLRRGPIGCAQMSDGPDITKPGIFEPGTVVRGGIWPSLNQTLVWALAGVDPAMAWDEWKKNSFALHAEAYPDIWYGVWSGTDSYNSPVSKTPGATASDRVFHGIDFPVLNLHSHACFLYSATKLLGIEFTAAGVNLRPVLPGTPYNFSSPLVGLARPAPGRYEGWYAPSRPGRWVVRIELPPQDAERITRAEINGRAASPAKTSEGAFELTGTSEPGAPLRWVLG